MPKQCNSKESCLRDLEECYNTPSHPIAFAGINNIYQYYKPHLSIPDIENALSKIENYTLHREYHSNKRNPSYSHFKRYQFQCDLVDIRSLSQFNNGVNYLLTCIDTFTRYAFVRLLTTKHGLSVVEAFKDIIREAITPPTNVVLDRGTEFYNEHFKKYCIDNGIILYSPDSSIHAAFIERFNRSLQQIIYKYMTEHETRRFIDYRDQNGDIVPLMPRFLATYNNRKHRMIGTTPYRAETVPECHLAIRAKMAKYYDTIKSKKPKFKVGDKVRVSKIGGKFARGYDERSTQEIFIVRQVKTNLKIPMYVLSNYRGDEIIKGRFYQHELTKVSNDVFRIEKVLKRRTHKGKGQIFVKWRGFDDSYNSWVDNDLVSQNFNTM